MSQQISAKNQPPHNNSRGLPVLGITMGDAAGIGPEIIVKSLLKSDLYRAGIPVVFGDTGQLRRAAALPGMPAGVEVHAIARPEEAHPAPGRIEVVDLHNLPEDIPYGRPDARCGRAAYEFIARAVECARARLIEAIVTAPLNKEALHLGGCSFPGHTEILANLTHTKDYCMMLLSPQLRVIHVSTHLQLRRACDAVTRARVLQVIKMADITLRKMGFAAPRIAVAGLNPHCGEGGLFGDEEIKEIIPAVHDAQKLGIQVCGPIAPDSVFHRAANCGEFDIVVAMYHDQGHIPLKVLGFASGVNVTVGLPCIRTSVDHGTAFEIAGRGTADCQSLDMALSLAAVLADHRSHKEQEAAPGLQTVNTANTAAAPA